MGSVIGDLLFTQVINSYKKPIGTVIGITIFSVLIAFWWTDSKNRHKVSEAIQQLRTHRFWTAFVLTFLLGVIILFVIPALFDSFLETEEEPYQKTRPTPVIDENGTVVNSLAELSYLVPLYQLTAKERTVLYSGPGKEYYRNESYIISPKTLLNVYGKYRGWILISFLSDEVHEFRFGWIEEDSLESVSNIEEFSFSGYCLKPRIGSIATDCPGNDLEYIAPIVSDRVVNGLAILNDDWIYCEFVLLDGRIAMGFIPYVAFFER